MSIRGRLARKALRSIPAKAAPRVPVPSLNVVQAPASSISREFVQEQLLLKGHVFFRGTGVTTAQEMHDLTSKVFYPAGNTSYTEDRGAETREQLAETVFQPGVDPVQVHCHSEMTYTHAMPQALAFGCSIESSCGTGFFPTRWGLAEECEAAFSPEQRAKMRNKGIQYWRKLGTPGKSKGEVYVSIEHYFGTTDPASVEKLANEGGEEIVSWDKDDTLILKSHAYPAWRKHPLTGEEHFANCIMGHHAYYVRGWPVHEQEPDLKRRIMNTTYGDGEEIFQSEADYVKTAEAYPQHDALRWKQGDVFFLDNYRVMHGRSKPEDPDNNDRRVMIALGQIWSPEEATPLPRTKEANLFYPTEAMLH